MSVRALLLVADCVSPGLDVLKLAGDVLKLAGDVLKLPQATCSNSSQYFLRHAHLVGSGRACCSCANPSLGTVLAVPNPIFTAPDAAWL